jgi:L-cysteine S-thiosulfotransferase
MLASQAPQDEVSITSQALKVLLIGAILALPGRAGAQELRSYAVLGDSISASLTGAPGDPQRGRAVVINRQNTCILCHSVPFAEEKFQGDKLQGDLAPNLAGAGSRWSEGQLRLRLVDAARLNPATIMPSYYRVEGLSRVGAPWRGKPILSAEQIEDAVAYLVTLRE